MALTITEVLNIWNQSGVFSYVLPFLLVFAITFSILLKSGILSKSGNDNRPLLAIISASVGLLALQMDFVSSFFASIFPRFGIGLAILLIILLFMGFLNGVGGDNDDRKRFKTMGLVLGGAVAIWALVSWDDWFYGGFSLRNIFYNGDVWAIVLIVGVVALIYWAVKGSGSQASASRPPQGG